MEQLVFSADTVFFDAGERRPGRLVAFGATASGRLLAAYLDAPAGGRSYLTARPMTPREQRGYGQIKDGDG